MQIGNRELKKIRELVYASTGITLGDKKDMMIKNRLNKLFQTYSEIESLEDLTRKLKNDTFKEIFINTFTTNKTHFFREGHHFEDLRNRVLPGLASRSGSVQIYCSASSTGEEPYSIAMTCAESKASAKQAHLQYRIVSSDIDTNVLRRAQEGIYSFSPDNTPFPAWINPAKYFKRRLLDDQKEEFLIKAKEGLKQQMEFMQMNLFDTAYPFGKEEFDVIFCRNVLIYFEIPDQQKILKRLFSHLKPGGTLYLGHSESPLNLSNYVQNLGQNVFVKQRAMP